MSKEVATSADGYQAFENTPSCYVTSTATAINFLTKNFKIDGERLFAIMPKTTPRFLANVLELLKDTLPGLPYYDIFIIPHSQRLTELLLLDFLNRESVVQLMVSSKIWIQDVRKIGGFRYSRNSYHALSVFGCYRPRDTSPIDYHIGDAFDLEVVTVRLNKLFSAIDVTDGEVMLEIFSRHPIPQKYSEPYSYLFQQVSESHQQQVIDQYRRVSGKKRFDPRWLLKK